jgi:hypothetical protein
MPKTVVKRKEVNGKSDEEVTSRRGRFTRGTAAAELPVAALVVTPEAASHARVSTPSSIKTSPPKLSSQLSSPSSNLSTAFFAELSACIKKCASSVIKKKKAEYIDFCDSAQVKTECLSTSRPPLNSPLINRLKFHSL